MSKCSFIPDDDEQKKRNKKIAEDQRKLAEEQNDIVSRILENGKKTVKTINDFADIVAGLANMTKEERQKGWEQSKGELRNLIEKEQSKMRLEGEEIAKGISFASIVLRRILEHFGKHDTLTFDEFAIIMETSDF